MTSESNLSSKIEYIDERGENDALATQSVIRKKDVRKFIKRRNNDLQELEDKSTSMGLSNGKPIMGIDRRLFLKIRKRFKTEAGEELR